MDKKPPASESISSQYAVDFEPLYDARDVALRCKVSEKSLQRWARDGKIPAIKFGKLWRFRKSAIEEWMAGKMAS
jgi:excisionase family DNA binding protein